MRRAPHVRPVAAAAALVLCSAFACTRAHQPAAAVEKVTLASATPPFTVLADVALARGHFREEGLEVTPRFHSTGKAELDEVLAGEADFATVAETPVMFAIMNGEPIAIVATIHTSNRTCAVFARRAAGIQAPRDLKGRRIAATFGSIGEYFLDAFLAVNGISRDDVTAVNVPPEGMGRALAVGEVDAASTWSSAVDLALPGLGGAVLTFRDEAIYTESFTIVATQHFIRAHPARVEKLLRALIKAEDFVRQAPAEAQRLVAQFRSVDQTALVDRWAGDTFAVNLDQSLLLALEDESRWAIRGGLVAAAAAPNFTNFVYVDALRSIKPSAARILR